MIVTVYVPEVAAGEWYGDRYDRGRILRVIEVTETRVTCEAWRVWPAYDSPDFTGPNVKMRVRNTGFKRARFVRCALPIANPVLP